MGKPLVRFCEGQGINSPLKTSAYSNREQKAEGRKNRLLCLMWDPELRTLNAELIF